MTRKCTPHVLGFGMLLLAIYTFSGLQGTCSPWDILRCDELKLNGNIFTLSGQMKQTIEAVNFAKYSPNVYIESAGVKTPITCTPTASFSPSKINIVMQCTRQLDNLEKGQNLLVEWKVDTTQKYTEQAVYEEEEVGLISGQKRNCNKVNEKLVCETLLSVKIPVAG